MPRLLVFYHFFHPDDVVSARHFADFAEEQQKRGWQVTVVTSNRACRDRTMVYPARENWRGIEIHRVFRPAWDQAEWVPRLGNSVWLTLGWFLHTLRLGSFDAIVIGSDPAFCPMLSIPLRLSRRGTPIIHWCFDLYPEAIEAEGGGRAVRALAPLARLMMKLAYRCYDEIVDLGPTMRGRLEAYGKKAGHGRHRTLVPWALAEPGRVAAPNPKVRAELFPRARLALLYSGTMGRAHDYELFLRLSRACRARSGDKISMCFSSRGNRFQQLCAAVTDEDTNISFAPFADEDALQERLEAADIHLLSLKPEWAGVVVPSKFFGSLAVGRPVIYAGPEQSEIAGWIHESEVGLHLEEHNLDAVVDRLHRLMDQQAEVKRWQENALGVYERQFSKRVVNDGWDQLLRSHLVA